MRDLKAVETNLTDLAAVLAEKVISRSDYREAEFRYGLHWNVGMLLGEVVDEHAPPLESEETLLTFEDELREVARGNLQRRETGLL